MHLGLRLSTCIRSKFTLIVSLLKQSIKLCVPLQVLECGVCEDVFSLQGDKVPRLLLCGHTVCHDCLTRLPLHGRAVRCPFDRQVTELGESVTWFLCDCFAVFVSLRDMSTFFPFCIDGYSDFVVKLLFRHISSGDSGVWGLKKNFALLELLERLQNGATNQSGMADDTLKGMGEVKHL